MEKATMMQQAYDKFVIWTFFRKTSKMLIQSSRYKAVSEQRRFLPAFQGETIPTEELVFCYLKIVYLLREELRQICSRKGKIASTLFVLR
jgi:hypothetical protein